MKKKEAHARAAVMAELWSDRAFAVVKALPSELPQPYYVERMSSLIPPEQVEAVYPAPTTPPASDRIAAEPSGGAVQVGGARGASESSTRTE